MIYYRVYYRRIWTPRDLRAPLLALTPYSRLVRFPACLAIIPPNRLRESDRNKLFSYNSGANYVNPGLCGPNRTRLSHQGPTNILHRSNRRLCLCSGRGPPLMDGRVPPRLFQFPTSLLESSRQIVQYLVASLFSLRRFRAGASEEAPGTSYSWMDSGKKNISTETTESAFFCL